MVRPRDLRSWVEGGRGRRATPQPARARSPDLPEQCPSLRQDSGRLRQKELQVAACEPGVDFGEWGRREGAAGESETHPRATSRLPTLCPPQCTRSSWRQWRPLPQTPTSTTA
jgi:hypothetical protein